MKFHTYFNLVAILISLTGCSAVIMSIGPERKEIIHAGKDRAMIVEVLGKPVEIERINPPLSAAALRKEYQGIIFLEDIESIDASKRKIVVEETYVYKGVIEDSRDIKDALAASAYTWGIGEFVMLPASIFHKFKAVTHEIGIWYDTNNIAVAYYWVDY